MICNCTYPVFFKLAVVWTPNPRRFWEVLCHLSELELFPESFIWSFNSFIQKGNIRWCWICQNCSIFIAMYKLTTHIFFGSVFCFKKKFKISTLITLLSEKKMHFTKFRMVIYCQKILFTSICWRIYSKAVQSGTLNIPENSYRNQYFI